MSQRVPHAPVAASATTSITVRSPPCHPVGLLLEVIVSRFAPILVMFTKWQEAFGPVQCSIHDEQLRASGG